MSQFVSGLRARLCGQPCPAIARRAQGRRDQAFQRRAIVQHGQTGRGCPARAGHPPRQFGRRFACLCRKHGRAVGHAQRQPLRLSRIEAQRCAASGQRLDKAVNERRTRPRQGGHSIEIGFARQPFGGAERVHQSSHCGAYRVGQALTEQPDR